MSIRPIEPLDLQWTFGDHLRKIRRAAGVSQDEFADAIGRGRKSVAAWESGLNSPRDQVAIAKRIELAFGVPAAWTLGLQESPHPDPDGGNELPRLDSNQQPFDSTSGLAAGRLTLVRKAA